jgi:hypothetical protein
VQWSNGAGLELKLLPKRIENFLHAVIGDGILPYIELCKLCQLEQTCREDARWFRAHTISWVMKRVLLRALLAVPRGGGGGGEEEEGLYL